ncbi:hypothetical protein [Parachitinimonas caeni]|uniref:Flagellar transcriptional regulator FlhC n=1 Tax=Parachitinimonas caeni TaxID=3031301 RepID=A0ABT7E447_9NEIS|nr:hypothetical protein [Parachitinimonas caeni]MDK2127099.1 hypothetical protein [Parachitinimonas caeni]
MRRQSDGYENLTDTELASLAVMQTLGRLRSDARIADLMGIGIFEVLIAAHARLLNLPLEHVRQHYGHAQSSMWSSATSIDGFRLCKFCGEAVRDDGSSNYHVCRDNE